MTMLRANSPNLYKKGTAVTPSPKKKRKRKKPTGKKTR